MRKLTAATLAVTAVISAGAGAAAASAAGPAPSPAKSSPAERSSVDRTSIVKHSTGTSRDRSGSRDTSHGTRADR